MSIVAAGLAVTVLVPLFLGSVSVIHGLRGAKRDVGRSVLLAATIWVGIWLGVILMSARVERGLSLLH